MKGAFPALRQLCGEEQLAVLREHPRLVPALVRKGLGCEDAVALSYNLTLLAKALGRTGSPLGLLEEYSLDGIADLCEEYRLVERGDVEYGEARP